MKLAGKSKAKILGLQRSELIDFYHRHESNVRPFRRSSYKIALLLFCISDQFDT